MLKSASEIALHLPLRPPIADDGRAMTVGGCHTGPGRSRGAAGRDRIRLEISPIRPIDFRMILEIETHQKNSPNKVFA